MVAAPSPAKTPGTQLVSSPKPPMNQYLSKDFAKLQLTDGDSRAKVVVEADLDDIRIVRGPVWLVQVQE